MRALLEHARQPDSDRAVVQATAADLVRRVRARARNQGAIEAFMRQYDLGSEEGVLLMCVAEALLRIPDQDTADKLIRDKLGDADWKKHMALTLFSLSWKPDACAWPPNASAPAMPRASAEMRVTVVTCIA